AGSPRRAAPRAAVRPRRTGIRHPGPGRRPAGGRPSTPGPGPGMGRRGASPSPRRTRSRT
ncbi:hypothetical protein STREPTOSP366_38050, partial [Streptomyces variabilis]